MSCCDRGSATRDLVRSRAAWLLWFAPAALVVVGLIVPDLRPALWIPALGVMGTACLYNARRCGRLHCHITGPLFLGGAVATVLDVAGVITIDSTWIVIALAAGTALAFGLEQLRGLYVAT